MAEARRAVQALVVAVRREAERVVAAGAEADGEAVGALAEAANFAADALAPLNEAWHRLWKAELLGKPAPESAKEEKK